MTAYRDKLTYGYKQVCDIILRFFFNIRLSLNRCLKKRKTSLEDKWHFALIQKCWEEGFEPQGQWQDDPLSVKSLKGTWPV